MCRTKKCKGCQKAGCIIEQAAAANGFTIKVHCGFKDVYMNEKTGREIFVLLPEFLDVKSAFIIAQEFYTSDDMNIF